MFTYPFAVFVFSFSLCMILVLTKSWHGRFSMDGNHGVQKLHLNPVPRVGGFGLAVAIWLFWILSYFWKVDWYAKNPGSELLLIILVSGLPALLFGLAEDVTKRVGVLARFLATFASGFLAWWFTGYALSSVDVPGFDWLLQWGIISVIFTAFAVAGVANSLNIIDGLNGLAGSTATWAFLAYGIMAFAVGDIPLASVSLIMAAGVFGFLMVNWPLGKIFMGDGGSYFVGFSLAFVAVLLVERNPQVSAFSALIVLAYPVIEVLFSIYRRMVRLDHPFQPDRLHFHTLFKRRYVNRWFKNATPLMRNSVAGFAVGSMTLVTALLGYLTMYSSFWAPLVLLLLFLSYILLYSRMVMHRWVTPWRFLFLVRKQPPPFLGRR